MSYEIRAGLEMNLKELRLPTILGDYQKVLSDVVNEDLNCEQYLYRLTDLEVEARRSKKIKTLLKGAKFPSDKTMSSFDFEKCPSIEKQVILELAQGHFLADFTNLVLFGSPGCGKTHLAIAIGRELCLIGKRVIFMTCCELVQELQKAKNTLTLTNMFKKMRKFDLIIIDELGYIPFGQSEADLLFQFVSDRYEKGSLLITSNLVFSEWDKVFKDPLTTSAAVDRIIHHSKIIEFKGDSFRTLTALKKSQKGRKKN